MFLLGWRFVKGLFLIALGFLIRDRDFPQVCTVHRITIFKHGRAKKIFNVQILKYFHVSFCGSKFFPLICHFQPGSYFPKWLNSSHPLSGYRKVLIRCFQPIGCSGSSKCCFQKILSLAFRYGFFLFLNTSLIFLWKYSYSFKDFDLAFSACASRTSIIYLWKFH